MTKKNIDKYLQNIKQSRDIAYFLSAFLRTLLSVSFVMPR